MGGALAGRVRALSSVENSGSAFGDRHRVFGRVRRHQKARERRRLFVTFSN